MILPNFRSSSLFIHSGSGKSFRELSLRRTFLHVNELLKYAGSFYCRVMCSCLCCWYLRPAQSSWVLVWGSVSYSISSVAVSGVSLQSLDFFHLEGCAAVVHLLMKYLCLDFWPNVFAACLQDGTMAWSIQEQDKAPTNICVRLFYVLGQDVLCQLVVLEVRELAAQ